MRKLSMWLVCLILLFSYTGGVWAQAETPSTVGAEREKEQKEQKELATRVKEVEQGGSLLPSGRLVIEPSFEYDHISGTSTSISGFTIFQAILIGKVQTETLKRDLFIPAVTVRAGLKDAELYIRIPYFFRTDNLTFPVSGGATTTLAQQVFSNNHIGDINSYIYYHAIREGQWKPWVPDTVLRLGVNFPTGQDPYSVTSRLIPSLGALHPGAVPHRHRPLGDGVRVNLREDRRPGRSLRQRRLV